MNTVTLRNTNDWYGEVDEVIWRTAPTLRAAWASYHGGKSLERLMQEKREWEEKECRLRRDDIRAFLIGLLVVICSLIATPFAVKQELISRDTGTVLYPIIGLMILVGYFYMRWLDKQMKSASNRVAECRSAVELFLLAVETFTEYGVHRPGIVDEQYIRGRALEAATNVLTATKACREEVDAIVTTKYDDSYHDLEGYIRQWRNDWCDLNQLIDVASRAFKVIINRDKLLEEAKKALVQREEEKALSS